LANTRPSASTVPRSVMKQGARMSLPSAAPANPVSIIAAWTTPTDMVDRAMPAMAELFAGHPRTTRAKANPPANGSRKLATPMAALTGRFRRSETGSISAPARNVRVTAPMPANTSIHGPDYRPVVLPARIPTAISTSATEIPNRTEIRLDSRARKTQAAATR
jgi:hypothetical protein